VGEEAPPVVRQVRARAWTGRYAPCGRSWRAFDKPTSPTTSPRCSTTRGAWIRTWRRLAPSMRQARGRGWPPPASCCTSPAAGMWRLRGVE